MLDLLSTLYVCASRCDAPSVIWDSESAVSTRNGARPTRMSVCASNAKPRYCPTPGKVADLPVRPKLKFVLGGVRDSTQSSRRQRRGGVDSNFPAGGLNLMPTCQRRSG